MDWEEIEQTKIQNRMKYKSKREHNRFYKDKYDDYEDSHLIHKFKTKKMKNGNEDE